MVIEKLYLFRFLSILLILMLIC